MLVAPKEQFLSQMKDVTVSPSDSITLSVINRKDVLASSGLEQSALNYANDKPFPYHVSVSLLGFDENWNVIDHPHKTFVSTSASKNGDDGEEEEKKKKSKKKKEHTYNFELPKEKKGVNIAELMGKKTTEKKRSKPVPVEPIFPTYHPFFEWRNGAEERICNRRSVPPPVHYSTAFRMLVHLEEVKFKIENTVVDIEPFFCELALYDVKRKTRLSEMLHVQLNSEYTLSLLGGTSEAGERQIKHGVFSVSGDDMSLSVCLVLTIYKVLHGELDASTKVYDKSKKKDLPKAMGSSRVNCKKYGGYRQLFAFAACPVFDNNLQFNESGICMNEILRLPRNDTAFSTRTLCETIERWKFSTKVKLPSTPLPAVCKISAVRLPTERRKAVEFLYDNQFIFLTSQCIQGHQERNRLSGKLVKLTETEQNQILVDKQRRNSVAALEEDDLQKGKKSGKNVKQIAYTERKDSVYNIVDINDETKDTDEVKTTTTAEETSVVTDEPAISTETKEGGGEDDDVVEDMPDFQRDIPQPIRTSVVRIEQIPNAARHKRERVSTDKSSFPHVPSVPNVEERKKIVEKMKEEKKSEQTENIEDNKEEEKNKVVSENGDLVLEVAPFSVTEQPIFNLRYQHTLYVCPQSLQIDNYRNIMVKVQLRENDLLNEGDNLPVIYPHANAAGIVEPKVTAEFTSVSYHCKRPSFLQEFKISLPIQLKQTHHLFFTFYNVSCKANHKPNEEVETLIGYSFLPLLQDNRCIDSSYTLPVFSMVPRQYLVKRDDLTIWKKGHPMFRIHTKMQSSLYTNEPYLSNFLKFGTIEGMDDGKEPRIEQDDHVSRILSLVYRSGTFKNHKGSWFTLSKQGMCQFKNPGHQEKPNTIFHITNETEVSLPESQQDTEWSILLTNTSGSGDTTRKEELLLQCESDLDLKSWTSAIYHMRLVQEQEHLDKNVEIEEGVQFTMEKRIHAIKLLENCNSDTLVEFTPVIFRMLLEIMCTPSRNSDYEDICLDDIKTQAFETFLVLVAILGTENIKQGSNEDRSPYLDKFAKYCFDDWHIIENPTHLRTYQSLPQLWIQFLANNKENDAKEGYRRSGHTEVRKHAAQYSWFIFDLINKSMTLHLSKFATKDMKSDDNNIICGLHQLSMDVSFYNEETMNMISTLVELLGHEINYFTTYQLSLGRNLNQNLACFFTDLFYLLKRHDLFDLIAVYLLHCGMDENTVLLQNRFTFLEIVCDHENYVPLSWIIPIESLARKYLQVSHIDASLIDEGLDSLLKNDDASQHIDYSPDMDAEAVIIDYNRKRRQLDEAIFQRTIVNIPSIGHFFPLVLIHEMFLSFRIESREMILAKASIIMRNVLTKHDFDMRYQDNTRKSHIATMYLPLLDCLWYNLPHVKSLVSHGVKKDILSCAIYVMRNVPSNIMIQYFTDRLKQEEVVEQWLNSFQEILLLCLDVFEYFGASTSSRSIICSESAVVVAADTHVGKKTFGHRTVTSTLNGAGAASNMAQLEELNKRREGKRLRQGRLTRVNYGGTIARTLTKEQAANVQAAGAKNVVAAHTTRDRLASHRTWKAGDVTAHNLEPLWNAERLWSAEVTRTVLDVLINVIVPLCDSTIKKSSRAQSIFLRFLHSILTKHQADDMVKQTFRIYTHLLTTYSSLLWGPERVIKLDGERCVPWWYELVRHMSFKHDDSRNDAVNFVLLLLTHNYNACKSIDRCRVPFLDGFASVFDTLRCYTEPEPMNEKINSTNISSTTKSNTSTQNLMKLAVATEAESRFDTYVPRREHSMSIGGNNTLSSAIATAVVNGINVENNESIESKQENVISDAVKIMEAKYEHRTELQVARVDTLDDYQHRTFIDQLTRGISHLKLLVTSDNDNKKEILNSSISEHCDNMLRIMELSAFIHNPRLNERLESSVLVEYIFELIECYNEVPRMQIRYLKMIYDVYVQIGRLPEAACVQIRMADIIEEQVKHKPIYSCHFWDDVYFEGCLHAASILYEDAHWYEEAVNCEHRLVEHFKKKRNYAGDLPRIVACHERLLAIYKLLAEWDAKGDARAFGRYYRVGFHGKHFDDPGYSGKLYRKEYIYREPKFTQLSEISSRLRDFYSKAFQCEVKLFKDSNSPSEEVSTGDIPMIQVTACVVNFAHDEEGTLRENHYHQSKNLRDFVYDTPFTLTGKSHGTTTTQYKRKTELRCASFPSTRCRHIILKREERVLSPIQCVLEDIEKRVLHLTAQVHPSVGEPDPKTLNQVLSGSVNMQVHGGAEEVCTSFLTEEEEPKYDSNDIAKLRSLLAQFLELCREGLEVTRLNTGEVDALIQFQELLDNGYANLMKKVSTLIWPELAEAKAIDESKQSSPSTPVSSEEGQQENIVVVVEENDITTSSLQVTRLSISDGQSIAIDDEADVPETINE